MLFTSVKKENVNINPLEGLNPVRSLVIMDFNKGEVIRKIENIGTSLSFELHESPWLFDENRFIYSVSGEKKIMTDGVDIAPIQEDQLGIYVYDLVNDQKKLLIPGGRFGVSSPIDLQISYIKDQSIWMMDLKDSTTKIVYKAGSKEKISNIHWTPDGKYIYIASFYSLKPEHFKSVEKLIEISTGKEVAFKKIEHGFYSYTWK